MLRWAPLGHSTTSFEMKEGFDPGLKVYKPNKNTTRNGEGSGRHGHKTHVTKTGLQGRRASVPDLRRKACQAKRLVHDDNDIPKWSGIVALSQDGPLQPSTLFAPHLPLFFVQVKLGMTVVLRQGLTSLKQCHFVKFRSEQDLLPSILEKKWANAINCKQLDYNMRMGLIPGYYCNPNQPFATSAFGDFDYHGSWNQNTSAVSSDKFATFILRLTTLLIVLGKLMSNQTLARTIVLVSTVLLFIRATSACVVLYCNG